MAGEGSAAGIWRARWRRILVVAFGTAIVGAAAILADRAWFRGTPVITNQTIPPDDAGDSLEPHSLLPSAKDDIRRIDFIGSQQCAGCHREQFDRWKGSTHGRAGGWPGAVRALAPFDGKPIRFRDAEVIPTVQGDVYTFTVKQAGRAPEVLRIDGFVGGGHMVGGGTQGSVSRFPDGTWRFLPFDWIRDEAVWFCHVAAGEKNGWFPITRELSLADCSDWPPHRVLGESLEVASCQSCHGSQIDLRVDPDAGHFRTELTGLDINCEACHGPGREHVVRVGDAKALASGDIGMRPLAALSKDESLGVCWSCHAVKGAIKPGYLSGKRLEAHYSLLIPDLRDATHMPDGRSKHFAYQESHLWSDCYVSGSMTCTSCHDPHTQKYRDVNGVPLEGWSDDRQCTSCHASKVERISEHTHHAPSSRGSRCVSCHMPFLQQPDIGSALRYTRSDHAIPIPRPEFDVSMGVASACRTCHERDERVLHAEALAWYGKLKPHPPGITAALRVVDEHDALAAAKLVLRAEEKHAAALLDGMATFAKRFLFVDMPSLDPEIDTRLRALAAHPNLDVRAFALASLHLAEGDVPLVRAFLAAELRAQGANEALVRARWSAVLLGFAAIAAEREDRSGAVAILRRAREIEPRNANVLTTLGSACADLGQLADAVQAYEQALVVDSDQSRTLVLLGATLARQNQRVRAVATLERALTLSHEDPNAHSELGRLLAEDGRIDEAIAHYERALATSPRLAGAHLRLSRLYTRRGDRERARSTAEQGLALETDEENATALRKELGKLAPGRPR